MRPLGACADPRQSIQFVDHLIRPELCPRTGRESLSRLAVDDHQDSEQPTVEQSLGDKGHRPGMAGTQRLRGGLDE